MGEPLVPIYEFYCEPCNGVFEVLRPMREAADPVPCPVCYRDGQRMMPSSFAAFTFRDGYPRRIPDDGSYYHLGTKVSKPVTGGVRPNEHPEVNKPAPVAKLTKAQKADRKELRQLEKRVTAEAANATPPPVKAKEKPRIFTPLD